MELAIDRLRSIPEERQDQVAGIVLGELSEGGRSASSTADNGIDPGTASFEKEDAAFRRLLPELLETCRGLFVAVCGERIVDQDADLGALGRRIGRDHPDRFVLVRRVEPTWDDAECVDSPENGR